MLEPVQRLPVVHIPRTPGPRGLRSGAWSLGNNRQAAGRFFTNPGVEIGNVDFGVATRREFR